MASTGLNFTNITPDNGAVRDLSKLVFTSVLKPENIGSLLNVFRGVYNGDKLGIVGEFGLLGKAAQGCSPEYGNDLIATSEKEWDIQEWEIAESLCYKDVEATLVKYAMNTGVNIDDLTDNEYLKEIIMPRLENAIGKMLMRLAWFGDKSAKAATDGGVLGSADYVPYFTVIDGLWKKLFAIGTADSSRVVSIAANAETTKTDQMSGIRESGVATGIFENLIINASPVLRQATNQVIYVTMSLKDALDFDVRANNKGSELQWKSIWGGVQETTFNGIKVVAIPMWDEIIQAYENDGTKYNKPHRAVYTTTDNLLLGVTGTAEFDSMDIWFDQTTRLNHILAKDKMGVLVAQDNLVEVAY